MLVARRLDKLKEVEAECAAQGVKVISVSADVSIYDDCKKVVKAAIDTFGRIDVLVNNAGIADKHRPITRCDAEWWDHVIKVDQYSVYYMMKEALVYMEQAHSGSIINISSIGGTGFNAGISYSAAKTAVISMSKNVGIQFAGTGIRCNVVAPGPTPHRPEHPSRPWPPSTPSSPPSVAVTSTTPSPRSPWTIRPTPSCSSPATTPRAATARSSSWTTAAPSDFSPKYPSVLRPQGSGPPAREPGALSFSRSTPAQILFSRKSTVFRRIVKQFNKSFTRNSQQFLLKSREKSKF